MPVSSSQRSLILTFALLAGTLCASTAGLRAQSADADDRDRQFETLARDADALARTMSVIKRCSTLVKPSVVHIEADKTDSLGRVRRGAEEAGSGMIFEHNRKTYVLTNRHVVRESAAANIRIKTQDGRIINPKKVWADPSTDIAVLEVVEEKLLPARIGDSDGVEIGDFVMAVGSPFGLSQSVTLGIVSAKGRRDLELNEEVDIQDFLQTDAAINPGNSGGPLINLRGEIIGINTAIASSSGGGEGIGFAIPSNIVIHVARQLIDRGAVVRGYLGVTLDHKFTSNLAERLGLPRLTAPACWGLPKNRLLKTPTSAWTTSFWNWTAVRSTATPTWWA
ncbi:MAG: trypsin-like peptidase domain-containing protein [Pirellulales bacterium]